MGTNIIYTNPQLINYTLCLREIHHSLPHSLGGPKSVRDARLKSPLGQILKEKKIICSFFQPSSPLLASSRSWQGMVGGKRMNQDNSFSTGLQTCHSVLLAQHKLSRSQPGNHPTPSLPTPFLKSTPAWPRLCIAQA